MRVVVFSRRADYDAVAPKNTDGYYRPDVLVVDAVVVINNDGTHEPGQVFLHELTHRLIRYYAPNTPLGLNEGSRNIRRAGAHRGDEPVRRDTQVASGAIA